VIALELSLDELNALGMEAAVIACSAPANKKMRMKLATISRSAVESDLASRQPSPQASSSYS
jgi:hypothetical protein